MTTNLEKFQQLYNTLIKSSDKDFLNSQKHEYASLAIALQESSFAFEHAADLLETTCRWAEMYLQTTTTLRLQHIEKMRREEAIGEREEEPVAEFENE